MATTSHDASMWYRSAIKSGTHGEDYQKHLAQVLLLRMKRAGKNFRLGYELTFADKFDDIGLYDNVAKQWVFIQSKHADGSESKIDLNGLLPTANQDKGDFNLYKYFQSYMTIRRNFEGETKLMLFTNKKLDEKLENANDSLTLENQYVDEYLQFTCEGATYKKLVPTETVKQSMIENANMDFHCLKNAIKELFINETITPELVKYKACLIDMLDEQGNNQIRFKDTFNCSLDCLAEVYRHLQNLEPVEIPPNFAIQELGTQILECPPVDNQGFEELKDGIKNLFENGVVSESLRKYKRLLDLLLTRTASGKLALNADVIGLAELYKMLSTELPDMKKVLTTKRKLHVGKDSQTKRLPFLVEASDVEQFFKQLTLAAHQPRDLHPFILSELHAWFRTWLRPDVLGKLPEKDEQSVVQALDVAFKLELSCTLNGCRRYLDQYFVEKFFTEQQSTIANSYPELNEADQSYVNRVVIVEIDDIRVRESTIHVRSSRNDATELRPISGNWNVRNSLNSIKANVPKLHTNFTHFDRTKEEIADNQFATYLKSTFERYQSVVLTAAPGQGKTEFLQYVSLEYQKHCGDTVFLLYLPRLQDCEPHNVGSLDVLETALSEKNMQLVRKVVNGNIESNGYITMFFDGYDEVTHNNKQKISNLFKVLLKSKNLHLVVTAREHAKGLYNVFLEKTKFISLAQFSDRNFSEYLAMSWIENFEDVDNYRFYSFANSLVEKLKASSLVLGSTPLMIKIVAETYKDRFEKFRTSPVADESSHLQSEFLDVELIYDSFIERSLLHKVKDKCNEPDRQNIDSLFIDHQLVAIKILDIDELKFVLQNPRYIKKLNNIFKTGMDWAAKSVLIKIVDDKPYFCHHSYAEYFVATFLWNNFVYLQGVVIQVLDRYSTIRRFVIRLIENDFESFKLIKVLQRRNFVSRAIAFWACEGNAVQLLKFVLKELREVIFHISYPNMLKTAVEYGSDKVCCYLIDEYRLDVDYRYKNGLAPLHIAVYYGHLHVVQLLLTKGADLQRKSSKGWLALHYAVHCKRIALAELLIKRGIGVNSPNREKWTAIHLACNNGDAKMVMALVNKGASLESVTNGGKTPLHLAASMGHTDVVRVLLAKNVNVHLVDEEECTALKWAAINGHKAIEELLKHECPGSVFPESAPIITNAKRGELKRVISCIDGGACVDASDESGRTALHYSAYGGRIRVVKLLLDRNANVRAKDTQGNEPLHLACEKGHDDVVEILINGNANVNVNAFNNNSHTGLHISSAKDHISVVKMLLHHHAKVNEKGFLGRTPLHMASEAGHKRIVELLLQKSANVTAMDVANNTPLHLSALKGHEPILTLLWKKGTDVNVTQKNGWTPLHVASMMGHKHIVERLLEMGANIDALDIENRTALHKSASEGHHLVVELLLEKHKNVEYYVNAFCKNGMAPLHYACRNGHWTVVVFLHKFGAMIDALNSDKETGLHLSVISGHCSVVELLLTYGANVDGTSEWFVGGCTPLYYACQSRRKNIAKCLIEHGADIEAVDEQTRTALHISASQGDCDISKFLLSKGANIHASTKNGYTPLHLACENGHSEVTNFLIDSGARIDAVSSNNETALHVSAAAGHCSVVELLLERGANANATTELGFSPFHMACANGHDNVIKTLINRNADFSELNIDKQTALNIGVVYGQRHVVELLLDEGACIEDVDENGSTPLHLACEFGRKDVVEALLRRNPKIDATDFESRTALHECASKGHRHVVELLLDRNADIEAIDNSDYTPLHMACKHGHSDVVELLTRRGANMAAQDRKNWTALHMSTYWGHIYLVKFLLANGANVDAVCEKGLTPLQLACTKGYQDIIVCLIENKADVNNSNNDNVTALHLSVINGYRHIMQLLLEKNANVNAATKDGTTAIHFASKNGHKDVVEILINHGANIDALDNTKCTALHKSAADGKRPVVELLLGNGANVDAMDSKNMTPLHYASKNGHKNVVKALISCGANIDARDNGHWTALHYSASNGYRQITDFLMQKGARIDDFDNKRQTPLHLACLEGHMRVVEMLVSRGASIDALDSNILTDHHLAIQKGLHKRLTFSNLSESSSVELTQLGHISFVTSPVNSGETAVRRNQKEEEDISQL